MAAKAAIANAADNSPPPLVHMTAPTADTSVTTENAQLDVAAGRPIDQEGPAAEVAFGVADWPQVILRPGCTPLEPLR